MNAQSLPNQADLRAQREADRAAWLGVKPRDPERYVPDVADLPARKPSRSLVFGK